MLLAFTAIGMTDKTLKALAEAIDALGDIPADILTEQQRNAYRVCIEARDSLLEPPGDLNGNREEQADDTDAHHNVSDI